MSVKDLSGCDGVIMDAIKDALDWGGRLTQSRMGILKGYPHLGSGALAGRQAGMLRRLIKLTTRGLRT